MSDETHQAPARLRTLLLPTSHHVSAAHAPKPRHRVTPSADPPRVVTYDGVEFLVMYDGVDRYAVEEA